MPVRAAVIDGRLTLDEPTDLPEGTVLDLVLADEGDDLDASEVARLQAALARSHSQALDGNTRPATAILAELRARR